MAGSVVKNDRAREATRRAASADSVFLSALAGTGEEDRVVIRHDVHVKAVEAAQKVLRNYRADRRRQI